MIRVEKIKEDARDIKDEKVNIIIEQIENWWSKKISEIGKMKGKLPPFDVDVFIILQGEGYIAERVHLEIKKFISGGVLKTISPPIPVEGDLLINPFCCMVMSNIVHPNIMEIDLDARFRYGNVCLGELVPPAFPLTTYSDYTVWREKIVEALKVPNYDSAYNSITFADRIKNSEVKPFLDIGGEK